MIIMNWISTKETFTRGQRTRHKHPCESVFILSPSPLWWCHPITRSQRRSDLLVLKYQYFTKPWKNTLSPFLSTGSGRLEFSLTISQSFYSLDPKSRFSRTDFYSFFLILTPSLSLINIPQIFLSKLIKFKYV